MKKIQKKLLASTFATAAFASMAVVPAVQADVSASVGAANMYYWRGMDLGGGAALSADINYSTNGFFVGAWTSSGDEALGTEYDLYAGYGGEVGDFNYSLSVVSYNYNESNIEPGDLTEVVLGLGYGIFSAKYYDNVAGSSGYNYFTLGLDYNKFSVLYGQHEDKSAHLDLSYHYNDNLSFLVGFVIDDGDFQTYNNDDVSFVVSLNLPINF